MKFLSKKNLLYTIIITFLFTFSIFLWVLLSNFEIKNPVAKIYKNGVLIHEIDTFNRLYNFEKIIVDEYGLNILLILPDGSIGVIEADCPDQICVNTGFIFNSSVPIICLPNRLEVRIVGGEDSEFAAVAR